MKRETIFSQCRKYRYTLWREWDVDLLTGCSDEYPNANSYVQFIGLNPSTADETKDDPTIRRCIGFAKAWGFGALCMTNLFAWRDTLPANMKKSYNPVGPDNLQHLIECAKGAGVVMAAWGKDGAFIAQDTLVLKALINNGVNVYHLGLNGDGTPKHPLYIRKDLQPIQF